MSKEIDQRVVEMRFDNQHFEKNVQTSMSTIDKLKQKLNFSGASKGLENISASAKKVDMSSLGSSVEKVGLKFNALYTMADQALRNITNSAMYYGKKMVSAITIDPVKTGLSEYETKINAIQVMAANTRGKNTMEDITKTLDDLNEYADKTIYNFAQMTSNVGKFTAQGYKVEDAANAVKGLANLAAASGASAEDMARATYQMSQALSGTIRLIDWNSLRNANMATAQLKETLKDLARVNGIAIDDMIKKHGTFEQTLSEGWLTGEMFTEAMNIYSGVYSEAELKAKGFTDSQIKNFVDLANEAESAATEVKTFTQLWDVLKETAQSGWTQTWEIIFGDFTTAKDMWTKVQNHLSAIINGWSDIRNTFLGGALNLKLPWEGITEKLDKAGLGKIKDIAEAVDEASETVEHFQNIVSKVWRGDFGNSDTGRFELLEKAGYNYEVVQDLVNKGKDYKITIDDIEASHKKFGFTLNNTSDSTKKVSKTFENLSDEQLRNAGLTEGEIRLYRDLAEEAERTGVSISDLVDEMSKNDGRSMLIDSIKNAWSGVLGIFKALKQAWSEIFPPMSVVRLYSIIKSIKTFSEGLRLTNAKTGELNETGEKLKRTFKGVFALLDIITTLSMGPLKIAFKLFKAVLEALDTDILTFTANMGDAIVKFRDWLDGLLNFEGVAERIIEWFVKIKNNIKKWLTSPIDSDNIAHNIITGLIQGFSNGLNTVKEWCKKIGTTIIDTVKDILGIHSPSTEFIKIGKDIIAGLLIGLGTGIKEVFKFLWDFGKSIVKTIFGVITGTYEFETEFGEKLSDGLIPGIKLAFDKILKFLGTVYDTCKTYLSKIPFGKLFAAGTVFLAVASLWKIINLIEPLADLAETLDKSIKKIADAKAWEFRSKALINFAIAIAILSVSLISLSTLGDDLWPAVGAISLLVVILGVLLGGMVAAEAFASKFGDGKSGLIAMSTTLLAIGAAILTAAVAVKMLANIDGDSLTKATLVIGAIITLFSGIIVASRLSGGHAAKAGSMILKMSVTLLIMIGVVKLANMLTTEEIHRGIAFVAGVLLLFSGIIAASKLSGEHAAKAGSMILKMSIALLVMVGVVKLVNKLKPNEIDNGIEFVKKVLILFSLMMVLSKFSGEHAAKAGSMMLKMSIAMLILVGVVKLLSYVTWPEIGKAAAFVAGVLLLFSGMIAASKLGGEHASKAGSMLLKMAFALLVLSAAMHILIWATESEGYDKAFWTIMGLMAGLAGIILASKVAKDANKTLTVLALIIGILSGVLIALSVMEAPDLIPAAACMSALMLLLGYLVLMTKFAGSWANTFGVLLGLSAVIVVLGYVLREISDLDPWKTIPNAIALSILLITLTVVAKALSSIGFMWKSILQGSVALLALSGVLAVLALILTMMSSMDVTTSMGNVLALGILIGGLTVIARALSLFGGFGFKSIIMGGVALLALSGVLAALALILAMMNALNVQNGMANALTLVVLIATLTAVAALMAPLGLLWFPIVMGGVALLALSGVLAVLALILAMMTALKVKDAMPNALTLIVLIGALTLVAAAMAVLGLFALQIAAGALALVALEVPLAVLALILAMMTEMKVRDAMPNVIALTALLGALTLVAAAMALLGNFVLSIALGALALLALEIPLLGLVGILAILSNIDATTAIPNVAALSVLLTAMIAVATVLGLLGAQIGAITLGTIALGEMVLAAALLPKLGKRLNELLSNVGGAFGADKQASVVNAVTTLKEVADIIATIPTNFGDTIAGWFGAGSKGAINKLPLLAKALKDFNSNLPDDTSRISAAITALRDLLQLLESGGLDAGAIEDFKDALNDLGEAGVDEFVEAFENSDDRVSEAGENMVSALIDGVESKSSDLTDAFSDLADDCADAVSNQSSGFEGSGKNLIKGLILGGNAAAPSAIAAFRSIANRVLSAMKAAFDEHSPSKETYDIGAFAGKGLILGVREYGKEAYIVGADTANAVRNGMSDAIKKIQDFINDDIDSQPTIRPVLDLSDVESGAGVISGLFNDKTMVGVSANVGSVNSMMNRRIQNGGNGDIISAIDKLRKNLGNAGGTTYNINGVTYDDGSNISDAVEAIVRAARVERRV